MRIDSAIKLFSEKYDREAIQSIEDISQERGLVLREATIKAFNIHESFDKFSQYLKEYASYKVENCSNVKASPQEVIKESVSSFIGSEVFTECDVKYADLPKFVMDYVAGVSTLSEAVDIAKRIMTEADVDVEAVSDVNEFADRFMDTLHESFDPVMERVLLASGYTNKKKRSTPRVQPKKPMFL